MKFQNGYNLIYEKIIEGDKKLFASKAGKPTAEDDKIDLDEAIISTAKLFYEGDNYIKASETGIPATNDPVIPIVTESGEVVLGNEPGPVPPAEKHSITYVFPDYYDEVTVEYEEKEVILPAVEDLGVYYSGDFYGYGTSYINPQKVYQPGETFELTEDKHLFVLDYDPQPPEEDVHVEGDKLIINSTSNVTQENSVLYIH